MAHLTLLTPTLLDQILSEAFALLETPGVKVQSTEALALLAEAGARVDADARAQVAHISESLARRALETVPREFWLYDRDGNMRVCYGGDAVHFDPGSAAGHILPPETGGDRQGGTADPAGPAEVGPSPAP